MQKTKVIRFRVTEPMDTFLKDLVKEMRKIDARWNKSELLRMIVQYFFMATTMGQVNIPFSQVQKDFQAFLKTSLPPNQKTKQ